MAQLTGLVGRVTSATGMTAKGDELTWAELDSNQKKLLDFVNLLGAGFNNDGTINIPSPASSQIVLALLPFMAPVGKVIWSPCELPNGVINPAQNGVVYLEADGQSFSPANFPQLSGLYGTKYNQAGDNPATTNRVPDLKRRFLFGRGAPGQEITGTPLAGGGFDGEETHLLLSGESGTAAHSHQVPIPIDGGGGVIETLKTGANGLAGTQSFTTSSTVTADAADEHNNMPPYAVGVFYVVAGYKLAGSMLPA